MCGSGNTEVSKLGGDGDVLSVTGIAASVSSDWSVTMVILLRKCFISPEGKNAKISALTLYVWIRCRWPRVLILDCGMPENARAVQGSSFLEAQ